ncbi:hypothetical protein KBX37_14855 [Micromonospora sp. U56]|uniref:hypothetical protein n=1 Tax=Micromonospora sp. U56 TaxID=2824900 RepID=UPI001B36949C|nr:hypothetical protein [Micromonospora sp. U56]MBQ0894361.1 hypothetical protein [Micromonospora sp. U56]
MEIVELEIAGHDWKSLRCGCGRSAAHLAGDLLKLARAQSDSDVDRVALDGHFMVSPSVLMEPALPMVSVALAALADKTSLAARFTFLKALLFIIAGEGQPFELARQGRDLPAECAAAAQGGIWLLYREVFSGLTMGAVSCAYEILTLIDADEERLDRVRVAAGARLSDDLR